MTATRERIESATNKLAIALGKRMNVDPVDIVQDIEPALTTLCEEMEREKQWRPISEAPRNKTMVALLHVGGDGFCRYGVGWYMPMEGWHGWDFMCGDQYIAPTHFQPLPQPPAT